MVDRETSFPKARETMARMLSEQIDRRKAQHSADLQFYALTFQDSSRLIAMRRKLWAQELLLLNAALEEICGSKDP